MGFLETSRRLRTDFFEAIERSGRITRSGMRWYSMAGIIATSAAPERSASAHWDGTVKESSYFPRSGPCVKPRTSGAVFRYSTIEMRTGFTSMCCLESNHSIANAPHQRFLKALERMLSMPSKPLEKPAFLLCSIVWRFLSLLLELRLCFSIFWSAGTDMALKCDLCGKGPHYGNVVSHANNTRRRRWNPNLKRVRAVVSGVHKQIRVCTACIRLGRVTKAA